MRILYCNKYNFRFSGTESYLFEVMELMRTRGHAVALFSMFDPRGQPTPYDHHFVPYVDFKQKHGILAQARLATRAIYSTDARRKVRAMIEDFRPDVAHVRNIYHHLSPSILWELKAQGVPVLYHMNDLKLFCPSYNMVSASGAACGGACKGGRFWRVVTEGCYCGGRAAATVLALEAYVHRWLRTYEKCVETVLAPSEFVKRQLIGNGWSNSKVQVLSHFQKLPLRTAPYPGPCAPILYFGRLSAEKGLTDLIAVMSRIPHLRLIIAGDGPQRSDLEKMVSDRGLQNICFIGHVSGAALEELIAGSQFTIFPSRAYETFGKSILESYAHGRAVIASDLGSRRELVHEGETGVLYEAGNVDQLAAGIKFLHERPELARALGEAGRELVREQYSPERHFLALSQIYEHLASRAIHVRRRSSACSPGPSKRFPLKIAYIGGRGVIGKYSGIETYYEETGKRLAAMGHDITVYCRRHFTPQTTTHNGMRLLRLPSIRTKHLETLSHTLLSTAHACLSEHDVVHYHALGPSWFSFLPRLFGKKTLVTVQGLDWQRRKWSWLARCVLKGGEWASARLPNQTVVVSRTLEKRYQSRYARKAIYIPNGTEVLKARSGLYLKQFGLASKDYVLFLGRFSPEKNCDLLIDAFERTTTDMKLVLAGGSSHTDDYAAQIRKRESDRIKILNWLSGDALQEVLTNAALFVLPSDLEGLSLSLLEAMGAGLCVLASDTPENCEVIADCGFTFKAGDVDDLRRMLTLILADAELRDVFGQKALARVKQNYLWDQVAAQIEATYRELIAQSAKAGSRRGETAKKAA